MKGIIKIIIVLAIILITTKGVSLTKKYLHAKRLKFSMDSFKMASKLDLNNLNEAKEVEIGIKIQNFSPSTFKVKQINIDAYTESGELIASQKNPLNEILTITPDQNNTVKLTYLIEPSGISKLIKEAGGIIKVGGTLLTSGKYGITLLLKGFVVAEGIKVKINEKLTF